MPKAVKSVSRVLLVLDVCSRFGALIICTVLLFYGPRGMKPCTLFSAADQAGEQKPLCAHVLQLSVILSSHRQIILNM